MSLSPGSEKKKKKKKKKNEIFIKREPLTQNNQLINVLFHHGKREAVTCSQLPAQLVALPVAVLKGV